jgi:hypothetical protein
MHENETIVKVTKEKNSAAKDDIDMSNHRIKIKKSNL